MLDDVKWLAPKEVSAWSNGWEHKHIIKADEGGMYQLLFERCLLLVQLGSYQHHSQECLSALAQTVRPPCRAYAGTVGLAP